MSTVPLSTMPGHAPVLMATFSEQMVKTRNPVYHPLLVVEDVGGGGRWWWRTLVVVRVSSRDLAPPWRRNDRMAVRILVAEDTGGGGRWRWDDLHLLSLSMRGYRRWRMLVVEGTGGGGRGAGRGASKGH